MCGVIGIVSHGPVNQLLYDGLLCLQHRGQDAAGIMTADGAVFHMHKAKGMVLDIFRTRNMRDLLGAAGIGHTRYPTAGSAVSVHEAQPFYVNSPFGITLAHNGNLTNGEALKRELFNVDARHINTNSDSEVLLNVFALELERAAQGVKLTPEKIFTAVRGVHQRCRGAYAVLAMIAGYGLVAFRDPHGIRPLVFGRNDTMAGAEFAVASETVALDVLGFKFERDVAPGEALFIDFAGHLHAKQCADNPKLTPCIFEYVYLARPDSVIFGRSVDEVRKNLGRNLARIAPVDADIVMAVPDSSNPAALGYAHESGIPFEMGMIRNHYVGRTFIEPEQRIRD
ncbi:MAG TPA: amidophosphoribosyltransferase, partial [Casimicrobium sp.]|nr:amidophosphoribosyltransferase [Casimicrobium sp.]